MTDDAATIAEAYDLTRSLYDITTFLPESERDRLGSQLRTEGVELATHISDALTTDDPVERQETLRQAGINCIRLGILIRLGTDLGHVGGADSTKLTAAVESVRGVVDRERRTVRRK